MKYYNRIISHNCGIGYGFKFWMQQFNSYSLPLIIAKQIYAFSKATSMIISQWEEWETLYLFRHNYHILNTYNCAEIASNASLEEDTLGCADSPWSGYWWLLVSQKKQNPHPSWHQRGFVQLFWWGFSPLHQTQAGRKSCWGSYSSYGCMICLHTSKWY